jgi:RNA polymerase sigma factor (sigma-70 family)
MATSSRSEVLQHLRGAGPLRAESGLTDGQLLEYFLERGDEAALGALVRRHGPMVWGVCCRILSNHQDAEDAFQATFLVLVRKAASIVPREMVANWLYGVARQTARKARDTAARRKQRERQVTEMPEPVVTEQESWRDLRPLLDEELSHLPDKYRVTIVLCDLEGKSRKEAARQLGLPEGTVCGRLARARRRLAKRLARHGLVLSGVSLGAVLSEHAASASVPTSVMSATIRTATLAAAGHALAVGTTTAEVAILTEKVVNGLFLTRVKGLALLVLAVGILGGALVFGANTIRKGQEKASQPEQKKPAQEEKNPVAPAPDAAKDDNAKLQGTWVTKVAERDGVKLVSGTTWVIQGDRIIHKANNGSIRDEWTFSLIQTKQPKFIYLNVVSPDPGKRKTHPGIYRFNGNTLELCWGSIGFNRPTEFATKPGDNGRILFVLERQAGKSTAKDKP